jgi:very-short-patch-repair endonuclease
MFEHEGHMAAQAVPARRFRAGMTLPEQRLWRELKKLGAHIRRQAPIGPHVADFACHAKRLVIEVDGGVHERAPEVAARDQARTVWLESQGYTVVRFTDAEVAKDAAAVAREIEKRLALPLDGEGLGWGVAQGSGLTSSPTPAPVCAFHLATAATPPSPALPPSRRKGE